MNGPEHPHVDVLANHHEGLLAGDEQATVQHHLAGCADCQHLVAQLDEVSRLLAAEGHRPVTMPSSVAARLEGALAEEAAQRSGRSAEQRDGQQGAAVTSLTSRRAPGARSAHRRVWPGLAAAAAVVVVSAVGIQVMQQGQGGGSADSSAGGQNGSAEEDVQEGAAAAPGDGPTSANGDVPRTQDNLSRLKQAPAYTASQRASVSALARDLLRGRTAVLDASGVCASPTTAESTAAELGPVSLIRWQGRPALLQVNVAHHSLMVLDCKTASRQLFATTY